MNKLCCVEDANICPKSSSCSMVLRSACSHRHSRESSVVKKHSHSSSPSRSKHISSVVKKEYQNGALHVESLTSSLKQLALKSTEKTYSVLTGGLYNSFEISEGACYNITETSPINVSCAKELHFSLSSSNNSSVYNNINHKECSSDYSSGTESDMNSSESLNSTSNMSGNTRRFTRSSMALRSFSGSEDDEDNISIHRIVRPRPSQSLADFTTSRQESETNSRYFSRNHVSQFERDHHTNSHFRRYTGNSDADSAHTDTAHSSESSYLHRSRVQNSLFHRFRWFLWSWIYLKIISGVNFDAWLLSRFLSRGKHKIIFLFLLPLFGYLILGFIHHDSFVLENLSQNVNSAISYVMESFSSIFSPILGYFQEKEEDVQLMDVDTALCNSDSSTIFTFFHGLSGLFGAVSGWLVRTGESASMLSGRSHQIEEFVHHQKEEMNTPVPLSSEEIKSVQVSREEVKILASELLKEEISSLKEFLKVKLQGEKTNKLEKDKKLQKEMENLHLEFKSLTGTVDRLEKEIMKQSENFRTETRENVIAITSEHKSNIDQLNVKLKAIEAKLGILERLKTCCDNQWSEADFLALLEKHLILAFKNVIDSDPSSRYHFFNEWLNSKFFSHEKLMQEINAALRLQSSHKQADSKMDYDNVIKIIESTVLKHVESVKRNLSELNVAGYSEFSADMFSEDKVKKIVKEAIMLYDADKTGQVDYALESGGGSILGTRCSETYIEKYGKLSIFGLPLWTNSNSPRTAIQPDVQPGRCWAFKGSQGFLVIELSATIHPTGFTLEHIPVSLSPTGSIDSAPKNFSVWGLDSEKDNKGNLLGEYVYDVNGDPLQYFAVKKPSEIPYTYVELQIHSNHGNMEYTCLYRFRVHGKRIR